MLKFWFSLCNMKFEGYHISSTSIDWWKPEFENVWFIFTCLVQLTLFKFKISVKKNSDWLTFVYLHSFVNLLDIDGIKIIVDF